MRLKVSKGRSQSKKLFYAFTLPFILIHPGPLMAGQFTVTRVYDGETIQAQGHGIDIRVRLAAIETPHILASDDSPAHRLALEAKARLADWVLLKKVEIEGHGLDEENRVIGVVYLHGVNINLEMVKSGYARVYRGEPHHSIYLLPFMKAERIARILGRGIWSKSFHQLDMFRAEN
jgi:micrococcal nuclease